MRPCCYQHLPLSINNRAESLQCVCSKKIQITILRENNLVDGFESVDSENCIANIARYDLSISHDESLIALSHVDANLCHNLRRNPGIFRTGIHNEFEKGRLLRGCDVLNCAIYVKDSHVSTGKLTTWATSPSSAPSKSTE